MSNFSAFLARLAAARYLATDDEIADLTTGLTRAHGASSGARGTYLRCLVARTQAHLRADPDEDADSALDAVNERMNAAVTAGLTAAGVSDPLERNRRSNFARTAKGALRLYIDRGGDVMALDPATVSKLALREGLTAIPREQSERMRARSAAARAASRLVSTAERLAELGSTDLAAVLSPVITRLRSLLADSDAPHTSRPGSPISADGHRRPQRRRS